MTDGDTEGADKGSRRERSRVGSGDLETTQSLPSRSSWSAEETNRNSFMQNSTVVQHYLLPDTPSSLGFQDTTQFTWLSAYLFGPPSQFSLLLLLVSSNSEF